MFRPLQGDSSEELAKKGFFGMIKERAATHRTAFEPYREFYPEEYGQWVTDYAQKRNLDDQNAGYRARCIISATEFLLFPFENPEMLARLYDLKPASKDFWQSVVKYCTPFGIVLADGDMPYKIYHSDWEDTCKDLNYGNGGSYAAKKVENLTSELYKLWNAAEDSARWARPHKMTYNAFKLNIDRRLHAYLDADIPQHVKDKVFPLQHWKFLARGFGDERAYPKDAFGLDSSKDDDSDDLFGNAANADDLFGNAAKIHAERTGLSASDAFGLDSSEDDDSDGPFGNAANAGNLFGNSARLPAGVSASDAFGLDSSKDDDSDGLFGNAARLPAGGSLFGSARDGADDSDGLFGNARLPEGVSASDAFGLARASFFDRCTAPLKTM